MVSQKVYIKDLNGFILFSGPIRKLLLRSYILGASEVSANHCNSRTSVLGRLRDYLWLLMKRSVCLSKNLYEKMLRMLSIFARYSFLVTTQRIYVLYFYFLCAHLYFTFIFFMPSLYSFYSPQYCKRKGNKMFQQRQVVIQSMEDGGVGSGAFFRSHIFGQILQNTC